MAEAAEKGGVSPLVLFTGITGHGQEAAHRELRLRLCGVMTRGGRCRVTPCVRGVSAHTYTCMGSSGRENKFKKQTNPPPKAAVCTVHCLQISTCVLKFLLSLPLPAASKTPPEDCVPMRGHAEASFPPSLFALWPLVATPPLSSTVQ